MAKVLVTEDYLSGIGNAIRGKLGSSNHYTPGQMATAISSIPTVAPTLISKSVVANGTYNASSDEADGYDSVSVNVPNSYASEDEGKVVNNGGLVAQESQNVSQNGTYDTTMKNQVVVAVPNSYSASDEGKVVFSGELINQTSKTITNNGTYNTTKNNSVVVNVSGGSGGIVNPDFQGLTYMYVNSRGEQIYISSQKNQYLNVFSVIKNHKYVLFTGETISTRRRAGFFEIDESQLEQYYDQYASADTLLFSNGTWIAPSTQGRDDTGNDLQLRSIITVPENGVILYGTSNDSTIAPAYCIDIT